MVKGNEPICMIDVADSNAIMHIDLGNRPSQRIGRADKYKLSIAQRYRIRLATIIFTLPTTLPCSRVENKTLNSDRTHSEKINPPMDNLMYGIPKGSNPVRFLNL
ncbi:MAG: hypothetical protein FVQ85_04530 [Planctomycetes bacterium]|nr:hypothetical protein [Planctomycetota bacterium]